MYRTATVIFMFVVFFGVPAVFAHSEANEGVKIASAQGLGAAKWKATSDEKVAKIEQQNAMIYGGAIVLAAAFIGAGISTRVKRGSSSS